MYICKRTLNPFFKKTNSTPQDLLDWVEFLMKECSDMEHPCIDHEIGEYLGKYQIYDGFYDEEESGDSYIKDNQILLIIKKSFDITASNLWDKYVEGNKQPLLDAIKEFKEKYKL